MTKYPIGLQNFQGLREDGYVYVDKTAFVYELAQSGKYYFLSRPRRFGKSLFLSTLEAYYQGKKELFKGLALEQLEKDWKVYPVLHLDLNAAKYTDSEALESILDGHFRYFEETYGTTPNGLSLSERFKVDGHFRYFEETYGTTPNGLSLSERFKVIIRRAYEQTGQKVVILVDEYDKPLLQAIGNKALQDEYRALLKSVYGVAKTMDGYIQMAFFTGVTKLSVDSLFGDLNNITNISLDKHFTELCGFTEEENRNNFDNEVGLMAKKNLLTKEECYAILKENYDGYHFNEDSSGMYNPFCLIEVLNAMKFKDFGPDTDTKKYIVETLRQNNYKLENLIQENEADLFLFDTELFGDSILASLYQIGYLTIKDYDQKFNGFRLGIPNAEVKRGLLSVANSIKSASTSPLLHVGLRVGK